MRCAEKVAAAYRLGHRDGYESARADGWLEHGRATAEALDAAREAIAETHQPIPVIQCECGWGVNCPECGSESNRIVGSVCRVCCDDWGDHGYCDDMHNEDDIPVHHPGGEMWSGPYCPVLAVIDALRKEPND